MKKSFQEPRSAWSVTRGLDRGRNCRKISDSSEFGSTMEEETLRECLRSLLDQSGVKNRQQALSRRRSDEKDRPAWVGEWFFTTCILGLQLESRKTQINKTHPELGVNRQLKLLKVPRSSFYYKGHREVSRVASDEQGRDEIMNIYESMPFYGVPRLTFELNRQGYKVNLRRVWRL